MFSRLRLTLIAVLFAGAMPVSADAQDAWPYRNSRTIFACLNTENLPGAQPNAVQCGGEAERRIADAYCLELGRPAAASWQTQFIAEIRDDARRSFRLTVLPNQNTRWERFDQEQFIFIRIVCA